MWFLDAVDGFANWSHCLQHEGTHVATYICLYVFIYPPPPPQPLESNIMPMVNRTAVSTPPREFPPPRNILSASDRDTATAPLTTEQTVMQVRMGASGLGAYDVDRNVVLRCLYAVGV